MSSRFFSGSEANASEPLENLEEIFPWYYMPSDDFKRIAEKIFVH